MRGIVAAVAEVEWRKERDRICKAAGWGDYESLLATGPGHITEPKYRDEYLTAHNAVQQWRAWGEAK